MNNSKTKDSYFIGIFEKYNFRFLITDCSNSVSEAVNRHNMKESSAILVSKAMLGAFFLAGLVKDEMTVSIQLEGNGEMERVMTYSNRTGKMRGMAKYPNVVADAGDLTLGIGTGVLRITRWGGIQKLHQSITALSSSNFEDNLLNYLWDSEQLVSFLSMDVRENQENVFSSGIILQALPETEASLIEMLQEKIQSIDSTTAELFLGGARSALKRIETVLGSEAKILEEGSPEFYCGCSVEKIKNVVSSMGKEEALDILNERGSIEMTCEFCREVYKLDPEEVNMLFL
ncbi:MAG: Hsp33 family molecular chaperone HslO [Leptospira sp.]|nr:Hsp33 family molecular chaperone HslO [Leptospira sp.]